MADFERIIGKGIEYLWEYRIVVKNRDGNILMEVPAVLGGIVAARFRKKWHWTPVLFGINWISPYAISIVKRTGLHPSPTEQDRNITTEIITIPHADRQEPERVILQSSSAVPIVKQHAIVPTDLQTVKGIGPKYETILNQAGIRTIAELSTFSATALQNLLVDYGITRKVDTQSWIDQAIDHSSR